MKALDKAINIIGSASALAVQVGVCPMTVSQWKKRRVPTERAIQIEALTKMAVTRHDLRPDIFGEPSKAA